jgi:hypothetical protein
MNGQAIQGHRYPRASTAAPYLPMHLAVVALILYDFTADDAATWGGPSRDKFASRSHHLTDIVHVILYRHCDLKYSMYSRQYNATVIASGAVDSPKYKSYYRNIGVISSEHTLHLADSSSNIHCKEVIQFNTSNSCRLL